MLLTVLGACVVLGGVLGAVGRSLGVAGGFQVLLGVWGAWGGWILTDAGGFWVLSGSKNRIFLAISTPGLWPFPEGVTERKKGGRKSMMEGGSLLQSGLGGDLLVR